MTIKELSDLSVGDILARLDLSDEFLARYREWCEKQPKSNELAGLSNLVYNQNPLLRFVPKEEK